MLNQTKSIRITYLGGAWPTNMGNSFIDLGSMHLLKMACPDAIIHFASEIPQWFFYHNKKTIANALNVASLIKSDYLVVSGMLCCDEFIKLYEPIISKLIQRNVKFVINGGGGLKYSQREVDNFRDFLKRNPPYAFISRDEPSFKNYSDLAKYSYNGIDCGFFLSDYFNPAELNLPDFVIFNFDNSNLNKFVNFIKSKAFFKKSKVKIPKIIDKLVVRTHHSCWPDIKYGIIDLGVPREYFNIPNTIISDIPEDYLNLYANTKATYSNRVHACVATLSFGNPAMLFSQDSRAYLFDRIGAYTIKEDITYPNIERIAQEKSKHIAFLSSLLYGKQGEI